MLSEHGTICTQPTEGLGLLLWRGAKPTFSDSCKPQWCKACDTLSTVPPRISGTLYILVPFHQTLIKHFLKLWKIQKPGLSQSLKLSNLIVFLLMRQCPLSVEFLFCTVVWSDPCDQLCPAGKETKSVTAPWEHSSFFSYLIEVGWCPNKKQICLLARPREPNMDTVRIQESWFTAHGSWF